MEQRTSSVVVELQEIITENETKSLWIFGYGSLCWNPGFRFEKAVVGHIWGYARKFWQGNNTHRGTKQKPGRVATLIKEKESKVNGIAFQISGENALDYLHQRECKLGGYVTEFTTFYPKSGTIAFTAVLYMATCYNTLWLGDAPLCDIANQITDCRGASGYNVEYLLRLAKVMRHHFPYEDDEHLYSLEKLVISKIKDNNMCFKSLMGDGKNITTFVKKSIVNDDNLSPELEARIDSFQYTTRVLEKTLRCLNI
ncbi:hypothetical protein FQA39_LY04742 [Lamprigera yunnana]|nr:hypothetical protein FQA39_LY04742 [Lamprigera yunnana]